MPNGVFLQCCNFSDNFCQCLHFTDISFQLYMTSYMNSFIWDCSFFDPKAYNFRISIRNCHANRELYTNHSELVLVGIREPLQNDKNRNNYNILQICRHKGIIAVGINTTSTFFLFIGKITTLLSE